MKKIFLVIILIILAVTIVFSIKNNSNLSSTSSATTEKVYLLTNDAYIIGEDLPKKSYEVKSIKKDTQTIVLEDGKQEDLILEVGDTLDLSNKDVISVTDGTLELF